VAYYMGDYYRGDFWSKLGKGIKRVGRDIGRAAKAVAPIAGIVLPAVGAATLVGRAYSTSKRIKEAGRTARALGQAYVQPLQSVPGGIAAAAPLVKQPPAPVLVSGMGIAPVSAPTLAPGLSTTTAARRTRAARAGYRRRKTAKRRTTTTRRRTRRRPRRRS